MGRVSKSTVEPSLFDTAFSEGNPLAGRCRTCRGEGEIETSQTTSARCVDCGGSGKTGGEPPNRPLKCIHGQEKKTETVWPGDTTPRMTWTCLNCGNVRGRCA